MNRFLKILAAVCLATPVLAEEYGQVGLVQGWQEDGGSYRTAIAFDLDDGWKTYWRVPGPAGIPPEFDWSGSENVASVTFDWPRPHVFESFGLLSIGYKGLTVLPVTVTPVDPSAPVQLDITANFGVCSDICIPAEATFRTELSANGGSANGALIRQALASGPIAATAEAACAVAPTDSGYTIETAVPVASNGVDPVYTVVEYDSPDVWIDFAESTLEGATARGKTTLEYYGEGTLPLNRQNIRITVLNGDSVYEFNGCRAM